MDSYSDANKHLTDSKTKARESAIATFVGQKPRARILTFPGTNYLTEVQSLIKRPDLEFVCLESKRDVFFEGVTTYNQAVKKHNIPIGRLRRFNLALEAFTTSPITFGYYDSFDSSWLDFIGGVTPDRTQAIREIWDKTSDSMILTLSYRTPYSFMADNVRAVGGLPNYFRNTLPDAVLVQEYKYHHGTQRGATFHHMEFKKNKLCLPKSNVP